MLYLRSPMARPVSAPSAKRESDDSPNCIQRAGQAVDGGMQKAFFKLGWFVGGHPCTVVWIMVLLTALCASGMSQTESETRGQIVWSPDDSNAKVRADQVSAAFGNSARTSTVYIQTKPPGSNVLTVEALNEVVTLASDVTGTTADASYKVRLGRSSCGSCFALSIIHRTARSKLGPGMTCASDATACAG